MAETAMWRQRQGWGGAIGLVAALAVVTAAQAQQDDAQICVNQCLYHYGPADNPAYHACVAERCSGPTDSGTDGGGPDSGGDATGRPGWTNHSRSGAHSAAVESGGRSLNYVCQQGGKALIGVAGLGGAADDTRISVDGQTFAQPFVAQSGILYTSADGGSALLRALMSGRAAEVVSAGRRAAFPLTGSREAIARAASTCGIRP